MIQYFRDRGEALLGRGRYNITVPVMDGPLKPNNRLEDAPVYVSVEGLDNLLSVDGTLYFSSGAMLMRRHGEQHSTQTVSTYDAPITCLAADEHGSMAVGLDGKGIIIRGGSHDGYEIDSIGAERLICPTAALFLDADTLVVASGSSDFVATKWKHDLMNLGRSGSIWKIGLKTGQVNRLADGLAFPYGLGDAGDGGVLVSEAWRHRIVYVDGQNNKRPKILVDELPGYPARLVPAFQGGWWLAIFAVCNQLFEFILQERGYCKKMMAQVDPEYWVAPALTSGVSHKEPLQFGALRQMGILKPWSPPRSYGLIVLLDKNMNPRRSWHSRADGRMHGVTSLCEHGTELIASAKGPGHALVVHDFHTTSREGA